MPAAGIVDELPTRVDWQQLFALKERWGVSLQALLMRCRLLKVMSESAYKKAMVALSSRGWRRQEPGEGTATELPSLLPRSVDLLESAGYPARTLAAQARVPISIFDMATSRHPTTNSQSSDGQPQAASLDGNPADNRRLTVFEDEPPGRRVGTSPITQLVMANVSGSTGRSRLAAVPRADDRGTDPSLPDGSTGRRSIRTPSR